jgi:hypothetical protein
VSEEERQRSSERMKQRWADKKAGIIEKTEKDGVDNRPNLFVKLGQKIVPDGYEVIPHSVTYYNTANVDSIKTYYTNTGFAFNGTIVSTFQATYIKFKNGEVFDNGRGL